MDSALKYDMQLPSLCGQCQRRRRAPRVRRLHESSLSVGDTAPCFTTTHHQSFCGLSASGQQLVFHLREHSFPSQHLSQLDLTENRALLCLPPQSHSKDVHGPKHTAPRPDLRMTHWCLYMSGKAARETITDPQLLSLNRTDTTKQSVSERGPEQSCGKPIHWHRHNILTGEQRMVNQVKSCRRTRDKQLWSSKRREHDHGALRLY